MERTSACYTHLKVVPSPSTDGGSDGGMSCSSAPLAVLAGPGGAAAPTSRALAGAVTTAVLPSCRPGTVTSCCTPATRPGVGVVVEVVVAM
eukprot:scaffold7332_cov63-Phaeocystis_antarctica.AAC.4